jgi:hypothetical protein
MNDWLDQQHRTLETTLTGRRPSSRTVIHIRRALFSRTDAKDSGIMFTSLAFENQLVLAISAAEELHGLSDQRQGSSAETQQPTIKHFVDNTRSPFMRDRNQNQTTKLGKMRAKPIPRAKQSLFVTKISG